MSRLSYAFHRKFFCGLYSTNTPAWAAAIAQLVSNPRFVLVAARVGDTSHAGFNKYWRVFY